MQRFIMVFELFSYQIMGLSLVRGAGGFSLGEAPGPQRLSMVLESFIFIQMAEGRPWGSAKLPC